METTLWLVAFCLLSYSSTPVFETSKCSNQEDTAPNVIKPHEDHVESSVLSSALYLRLPCHRVFHNLCKTPRDFIRKAMSSQSVNIGNGIQRANVAFKGSMQITSLRSWANVCVCGKWMKGKHNGSVIKFLHLEQRIHSDGLKKYVRYIYKTYMYTKTNMQIQRFDEVRWGKFWGSWYFNTANPGPCHHQSPWPCDYLCPGRRIPRCSSCLYMCQGRSTPYIGDGHPTFNGESL